MNKLLKKGFLAFFLSVYLRSDDLVTYTIIKEEDLGYQRFLAKKCLRGKAHSPCFAEPKKPKRKLFNTDKSSHYYGTSVVQMSWLQSREKFENHSKYRDIPFAEVSLIYGYKQFFPKKERYGLRFYISLDYAYGFFLKNKGVLGDSLRESSQIPKAIEKNCKEKRLLLTLFFMAWELTFYTNALLER
ncbi:hypothetical protein ID0463_11410 [Helicobacter pylori]